MIWSFIAGLMLTPITIGVILLLAYLDMRGYIAPPDMLGFAAGGILGAACFAASVLLAMGR